LEWAAAELSKGRTIATRGVIVRMAEGVNDRCKVANDRTRAVIVRSYRKEPVELNMNLKRKIRLRKLKITKNKTKIKD
jgi:hypothetical protein